MKLPKLFGGKKEVVASGKAPKGKVLSLDEAIRQAQNGGKPVVAPTRVTTNEPLPGQVQEVRKDSEINAIIIKLVNHRSSKPATRPSDYQITRSGRTITVVTPEGEGLTVSQDSPDDKRFYSSLTLEEGKAIMRIETV